MTESAGMAESATPPGPHFHEHQHACVLRDDVQLAVSRAIAPVKNVRSRASPAPGTARSSPRSPAAAGPWSCPALQADCRRRRDPGRFKPEGFEARAVRSRDVHTRAQPQALKTSRPRTDPGLLGPPRHRSDRLVENLHRRLRLRLRQHQRRRQADACCGRRPAPAGRA